ncbi:MAG: TIGR00341 family protein [Pseudomonadota bacterium]|nr:TIGR00341 family protein [Pseudomonadota bacterium]
MKIIEVIADKGHEDTINGIAEQYAIADIWWGPELEGPHRNVRLLVGTDRRQKVMNALQSVLQSSDYYRIVIIPVESVLPQPDSDASEKDASTAAKPATISREELYSEVSRGATLDSNYLLLVVLSTIVATVGLIEDNVAVIVGAMVIAPLLGPNLALALGTALGDRALIRRSLATSLAGMGLALALSLGIGLLWPADPASGELMSRTEVGIASMVLALASGAAGVLSLTSGVKSTLVGVMVAVALLPPTATIGLMLGIGQWGYAANAAVLLSVNVVCVNLSANLVLMWRDVRPRTWAETREAHLSLFISMLIWVAAFLALAVFILYPAT